MKSKDYDPKILEQNNTLLLDNIFASFVTLIALQLREEESEAKKNISEYIDPAFKLIMESKKRIHEITIFQEHNYF